MVYHSIPILGKHFPDWHPITNKATLKQMTTSRIPAEPVLSKGQEVAEQLRDLIAQQKLAPGERLRERDLAAQLSVSRTPMREALRLLAAEGLVEIHTNRGAIVANPGYEEIEDLLRLLGTLEGLAGEQAAERATDAEIVDVNAPYRHEDGVRTRRPPELLQTESGHSSRNRRRIQECRFDRYAFQGKREIILGALRLQQDDRTLDQCDGITRGDPGCADPTRRRTLECNIGYAHANCLEKRPHPIARQCPPIATQ